MALHAVFTGDIVDSRKLSASGRTTMLTALHQAADGIAEALPGSKFEISRGDSFQGTVPVPAAVLREVVFLKSRIMSTKTAQGALNVRCGIGLGAAEFPSTSLAESDGTAFRLAGEALDKMPDTKTINIFTGDVETDDELNVAMLLLQAVMSRWTPEMAEVIHHVIRRKTQAAIGTELGINQSAVNHRLRLARYEVLPPLFKRFETLVERLH